MRSQRLRVLAAGIALAAGAAAAAPAQTNFTITDGARTFSLSAARGRFAALHFLSTSGGTAARRIVQEYARRAPEVAGVSHVFLLEGTADEARAFVDSLAADKRIAAPFHDAEARVAQSFRVGGEGAVLVLIGPDGQEVYRHVAKSAEECLAFDDFAAEIARRSANPALREFNVSEKKPAISGYDPVSYFSGAGPAKGKAELESVYAGVRYRFSTAENRRKFAENPAAFLPAYGGWCATAMADGRKVEIEPTSFKITDGRLLLFYKGWLGDALKEWNKDERGLTRRADEHWRKIAPSDATGGK